jgi:Secretion system C-terminal sorting domain
MKKNLLFLLVFALYANVSLSQNYKIESTLGGVGNVGDKITYDGSKYFVKNQSIYFLDPKTEKMIVEVTQQGIIKNKYTFPIFSNAKNDATFGVISKFLVDVEDRFIAYTSNRDDSLYCLEKSGKISYRISISSYLNGGYKVCLTTDSKNNLYVGTKEKISVLDKNGKFLYSFGKKGINDGEFTDDIYQIFIDDKDNIFVRNNERMQQFDNQGKFISKFTCLYKGDLGFDGKNNFYGCPFTYSSITTFDTKGVRINNTEFGDGKITIYSVLGLIDGNIIVQNDSGYNLYDKTGKLINTVTKLVRGDGGVDYLVDFQFDMNDNIWIIDWLKTQIFDKNFQFSKRYDQGYYFDNEYNSPLLSVNGNADMVFLNSKDKKIYTGNLSKDIVKEIFTIPTKDDISYLDIDSTKKEIIVMVTPFSTSNNGTINVYGFDGNLKKNFLTAKYLKAMVKGSDGNSYVLSQPYPSNKYFITVYDENAKITNSFDLGIGEFADSPMGIIIDEYGIIHLAIRNVYGGQGFSMYAFDKKGKLLVSKTNIADNKGNFTSNSSYLLKYRKGSLYLADFISNQIFKIKFSPSGSALKEAALTVSDITKTIDDKEFTLAPTSNSKGAIAYALTSGDAISVSNVGLVKILKNGIAKVKISQAETTEYLAAEKIITITVKLLTAQITQIAAITKLVGDADFDLKPVSNSDGKVSFKILSGDAVSVGTTGTVKIVKAGKATIQISQAESVKYEATTSTVDVTVNKLTQTITFEKLAAQIPTNSSGVALKATTNGSLSVTFKVISGPASISNNVLKPSGTPGNVVVEATQIGDDKYDVASSVRQTVEMITVLANSLEEENGTVIYPNPTHEFLYIKSNKSFNNFQITSMNGTILNQNQYQKEVPINVSGLKNGAYLIKLIDKNQDSQTIKFVIE